MSTNGVAKVGLCGEQGEGLKVKGESEATVRGSLRFLSLFTFHFSQWHSTVSRPSHEAASAKPHLSPLTFNLSLLLAALLLLATSLPSYAKTNTDEPNFLELAAVLASDGNYDKAAIEYAKVDAADPQLDAIKYHTLGGLIALNQQQPEAAVSAFDRAIAAGQTEPTIFLYLAQAQFGLERYADVLQTLDRAGAAFDTLAPVFLMRAQAHWLLQDRAQAFAVLADGARRFPGNTQFLRREVFFLMELGLYQEAAARGQQYLTVAEGKEEDYVAIGNALKRARQFDGALVFLESARLKFPASLNVVKVLAATYLEKGEPLAAGELMYRASLSDPTLKPEAAELFRRAHLYARALAVNAQIEDQSLKLKQRLGILIELGRFAEVRSMEGALKRTRLLDDEDVRYALAYALFKEGDFDAAEVHLSKLTKPDLFRKATELRQSMQECAAERWRCA
jgi:tetratricopeptide (TPR) repeat protein